MTMIGKTMYKVCPYDHRGSKKATNAYNLELSKNSGLYRVYTIMIDMCIIKDQGWVF